MPHLFTFGASLSREDLDAGGNQDEEFCTIVVRSEYNKDGVITYMTEMCFPLLIVTNITCLSTLEQLNGYYIISQLICVITTNNWVVNFLTTSATL